MNRTKTHCLLLLSGGIDSAACLNYYWSLNIDVKPIFVNYGQAAAKEEIRSAKAISNFFGFNLEDYSCDIKATFYQGEIKGRNAFLILIALLTHPEYAGIISLGIHSGTTYYDCSPSFVKDMNKLLGQYTSGQVKLDTPWLNWNKKMIIDYCRSSKIPVNLTYSCENGTVPPCGKCNSCLDRIALHVN